MNLDINNSEAWTVRLSNLFSIQYTTWVEAMAIHHADVF